MCGSTVDIQSLTADIRRGKKEEERRKKKLQDENIVVCPITQGGHKINRVFHVSDFAITRAIAK